MLILECVEKKKKHCNGVATRGTWRARQARLRARPRTYAQECHGRPVATDLLGFSVASCPTLCRDKDF